MPLYNLTFHGSEDSKHVLLEGPELSIPIQKIFEAMMEIAAARCLKKFNSFGIEIMPEDIFDETVEMLTERGFRLVKQNIAVFAGIRVGTGDFSEHLGESLSSVLSHNEQCHNDFLKEVYDQVEMDKEAEEEFCSV